MAKLFFFHSVMNAGKSTHLLQAAWNYTSNGGRVLLLTSSIDDRSGVGVISSRVGLQSEAKALHSDEDLFDFVRKENRKEPVTAVLMDEVQFMTAKHMHEASGIVDTLGVPVMAYGLKNNIHGELFSPAISALLALADQINEIKQLCHCGKKATMILRYCPDGSIDRSGPVVEVGGEGRYVSVCRPHFKSGDIGPSARHGLVSNAA